MVGFGINSAGFAKGLDDGVREGKRKQVGVTAGKPEDREETPTWGQWR